ncbi:MAG: ABC transporter substrate-binding protein, partial [Candidatus Bipolaricaulia bacterium]
MRSKLSGFGGMLGGGMVFVLLISLMVLGVQAQFPVPREQAVVTETDTNFANFDTATTFIPRGTQWGSGWHQVANEWDWYINYATGDTIFWRTTGWEYSDDNMQLTWHVRPGVFWNDGEPYTAHDHVFTLKTLMADPGLVGANHVENVVSAVAVDDFTVLITFKQPDYRFHHKFRMWGGITVVAEHTWEDQNPREFRNWPPVETGPYVLHGLFRDLGMFVWERNPDYWAREVFGVFPGPKYYIARMAPPPDLDLAEYIQGNVDLPLPHIFTIQMIRAAERRADHVVTAPFMDAVSQGICSFNTAKAPLDDPEFRWAIQYLVNRDKHARVYPMAEESFPTMWPWPDYGSLDKFEFSEIIDKYGPRLRYDPAEAARILDRLGFRRGPDG